MEFVTSINCMAKKMIMCAERSFTFLTFVIGILILAFIGSSKISFRSAKIFRVTLWNISFHSKCYWIASV